jgi:hypothetical protein
MKLLHNNGNRMVLTGTELKYKGETCVVSAIQQPRDGKKVKHPRGCVWLTSGKAPKINEQAVDPEALGMHWGGKEQESGTHADTTTTTTTKRQSKGEGK